MSSVDDLPRPGLRERKKAKTRAAIQRSALRLFREQGYEATTVEQIAEAAEISPSTFFRYFPAKEDVALYDELDPRLIAAYEAQPANWSAIRALRAALREVFARLPAGEAEQQWERSKLILSTPELRMRMLDQYAGLIALLAHLVAERVDRPEDDPAVQTYAGAALGALLSAYFVGSSDRIEDFLERMDQSLQFIEDGMPL